MLKKVWTFKPHEWLNNAGNVKEWELRSDKGDRTFVDEVTRVIIIGLLAEIPDQDWTMADA